MSPARLARRALVTVTAGALIATGVFATPAHAAPASITDVNPSVASNDSATDTSLTFTADAGTPFTPGATVTLTGPSVNGTPYTVTNTGITTKSLTGNKLTGSFTLTGAAPGDYSVAIKNLGSLGTDPDYFCAAGCFKVSNPTPTVAGIARSSGNAPSSTGFTITGTGFAAGVTVAIKQSGIIASHVVWTTSSQTATSLVGTLAVDATAVGGAYDVVITNTDNKTVTCGGCFVVPKSTSIATSLNHALLAYGAQSKTITVTGVGFTAATKATFLQQSGSTNLVTVGSTTFVSSTELDLVVSVADPAAASAGTTATYDLVTTDKGDGYYKLTSALTLDPRPTPTSTPYNFDNPGASSSSVQNEDLTEVITGTGFHPGMAVAFNPPDGITVDTVAINPGGTTATFRISLTAGVALTDRALILTNPDDFGVNPTGAKTLKPSAAPVINGVTPAAINHGVTSVTLTVHGTGIGQQSISQNGATASTATKYVEPQIAVLSGTAILGSGLATAASDGLSSSASITFISAPDSGTYDVKYFDHNGSVVVCSGCFNVDQLSVTSVSPTTQTNDTSYALTVGGSGFVSGASLRLQKTGQADIVATGVSVPTGSSASGTFDLTGVAPGAWSVRVTNPDGSTGKLTDGFTVSGGTPSITTPSTGSPASLAAGNPAAHLALTGSNLAQGATLSLTCGVTCPTVVGSTWTSLTSMSFTLDTRGATPGPVSFVLTNTDGKATSSCACLTITTAPAFAGSTPVSPASRAAGSATFTMTLSGSGFSGTPTVTFSGAGVTAGTASAVTGPALAQTFTVPVTVDALANTGARDVTATNADGSAATCAGCFSVLAPPTVSAISPSTQKVGTGPTNVTITGTGFNLSGVSVTFSGLGVTAGAVTVNSATSLTVPVTVTSGAAHTARDVTVTNTPAADGGTATKAAAFLVGDVPGAPTGIVTGRSNQTVTLAWNAPADDGGLPITGYSVTVTHTDDSAVVPAPTVTVSGQTASITGLTNGTAYKFVIKATNAAGSSAGSTPVTVTPATTPNKVLNVLAAAGDQKVTLSWTAPADGGDPITSYVVTVSPPVGDPESQPDRTPSGSPYAVTGLTNGKAYTFSVAAVNGIGTGTASDTTAPVTPAAPAAGAPSNLVADPSTASGEVDLTWSAPSSGGTPTSYVVTVSPSSGSNQGTTTYPVDPTTTSATVTGLTNGVSVSFTVHAVTAGPTNGAESSPATATPYGLPGAVTQLSGSAGDATVSASWHPPTDDGGRPITGYVATLSPGGTTKTVTANSVSFSGLVNGTSYTIGVRATNLRGNGPSTSTGSLTPAASGGGGSTGGSTGGTSGGTTGGTPTPTASPSPSATATKGASTVTLNNSASVVMRGQHLALRGTVTRATTSVAPGSVTLKSRTDDGVVHVVATVTPSSTGAYSYDFAPAYNASYQATYAGDSMNTAAASAVRRTLVAARVSASAPTGPATTTLDIRGAVLPNKAGQLVTLYRVSSTGVLTKLAAVRLWSNSTYEFRVRLPRGNYLLQVGIGDTSGNRHGEIRFVAKRT